MAIMFQALPMMAAHRAEVAKSHEGQADCPQGEDRRHANGQLPLQVTAQALNPDSSGPPPAAQSVEERGSCPAPLFPVHGQQRKSRRLADLAGC